MTLTDDRLREGIEQLKRDRHALALEAFTLAADDAESPDERRAAEAFAAQVNLALGRPYEVVAWAERLRASSPTSDEADLLEASAWVALADGAQALELLASVEHVASAYSEYPQSLVHQLRCQAHGLVGDLDAALVEAFTALLDDWALPEIWRALAVIGASHEVDLSEAVGRVPDDGVLQVLGWLVESPAAGVDQVVEALWQRQPGDRRVLALVTALGNQLPIERALEWSARLRAAGLVDDCAVLGIAANETRPAAERVRAAAVAASTFHDPRAVAVVEVAATALADDEVAASLSELVELGTDDLVDAFVVAAATSAARALALAGRLAQLGAHGPATALTRHATELTTGQPAELRAAVAASLPPDAAVALLAGVRSEGHGDLAALVEASAH